MPTEKTSGRYRFSVFEVDSASGELLRQGVRVKLQEQPFRLLVLLLERPGEVVTREELRGQLWPEDTFVEFDNSLNVAVRKLRDALRDDADTPRFVETIPKRGFRFLAPVSLSASDASPAATATPASPDANSGMRRPAIVVLPFSNMSSDSESEFFTDGITEEIINALTQIENLRVVARTSAFSFKGKQVDLRTVGASLNVTTVLEGSVRKSGNRVRIVAQLIDAVDGYHIWSERYDRELQDIFEVQDEIARTIAEKMKVTLGVERHEPLVRSGTKNLEAYQLYLKGRFHWNKRSADGLRKAVEYFQEAIAKDPNYAVAFAGLADAYDMMAFRIVLAPGVAMPKAKAAAARALELDPHLAEPHVALAYASFTYDRDWPAAARHFEHALTANSPYVLGHAFYALYLSSCGRSEESISVAKRALELDPAAPAVSHALAVQLYLARDYDLALEQCHQTIDMDPNYEAAFAVLGQVYSVTGRYREALVDLEKNLMLTEGSPWASALLGYAHARAGERTLARQIIEELKTNSKRSFVAGSCFALVYAALEEPDQAFAWLQKACEERNSRLAYLKVEALWDPLRFDPRFDQLLQREGFPLQGQ